ncbi:MAG TPA: NAD(P)/FAD-dependent oxidoreductase [Blastocatellia bacterium]|nr:NAD(P)/FAD-dependent oxidoreductase [Blastocatellia bacterium]
MQSLEAQEDAIIVGGGLAGLATSIFLARQGKKVRLLEQAHELGGRARTGDRDGFLLNLGPHALYRGGEGMAILRELGVEPRGAVPPVSGYFAIHKGVKHTFPAGFTSLLATGLFGLAEKIEAARLLASLGKLDPGPVTNMTAREWVDRNIAHEGVREFMLALFRVSTYANDPERMSAGAGLEQLRRALEKGVLYLDGGWRTLVDGLREIAEREGVTIQTGSKVEAIERGSSGEVKFVRLSDGRAYHARSVIVAASPGLAASLVEGSPETSLRKWADELVPIKAACLDVALSHLPRPKATFALGIDEPFYLSVHSATAKLAPEGGAMIQLAKYRPADDREPSDEIERRLEGLLNKVQAGWRDAVVYRRFLPDMIVSHALPTAALGGTKGRPEASVRDVPGLFVVGDWVGPEGMLADASLASAKRAATLVSGRETLEARVTPSAIFAAGRV